MYTALEAAQKQQKARSDRLKQSVKNRFFENSRGTKTNKFFIHWGILRSFMYSVNLFKNVCPVIKEFLFLNKCNILINSLQEFCIGVHLLKYYGFHVFTIRFFQFEYHLAQRYIIQCCFYQHGHYIVSVSCRLRNFPQ